MENEYHTWAWHMPESHPFSEDWAIDPDIHRAQSSKKSGHWQTNKQNKTKTFQAPPSLCVLFSREGVSKTNLCSPFRGEKGAKEGVVGAAWKMRVEPKLSSHPARRQPVRQGGHLPSV